MVKESVVIPSFRSASLLNLLLLVNTESLQNGLVNTNANEEQTSNVFSYSSFSESWYMFAFIFSYYAWNARNFLN